MSNATNDQCGGIKRKKLEMIDRETFLVEVVERMERNRDRLTASLIAFAWRSAFAAASFDDKDNSLLVLQALIPITADLSIRLIPVLDQNRMIEDMLAAPGEHEAVEIMFPGRAEELLKYMGYCPECGTFDLDDSKFCVRCGAKFDEQ
jgi:hypothetical protein